MGRNTFRGNRRKVRQPRRWLERLPCSLSAQSPPEPLAKCHEIFSLDCRVLLRVLIHIMAPNVMQWRVTSDLRVPGSWRPRITSFVLIIWAGICLPREQTSAA
jgi:hypothetical protein